MREALYKSSNSRNLVAFILHCFLCQQTRIVMVYGTDHTIQGLREDTKDPQEMIDEALANNPSAPS